MVQAANLTQITVPPRTGSRAITVQTDLQTLMNNNDPLYNSNYQGSAVDAYSYQKLKDFKDGSADQDGVTTIML